MTMLLACVATDDEAAQAAAAGFDGVVLANGARDHRPAGPRRGAGHATTMCWIEAPPEGDPSAHARLVVLDGRDRRVLERWLDRLPGDDDLEQSARRGCDGLVLQATERLLDAEQLPRLAMIAKACRSRGLLLGLAGGLEPPDVPRLLGLGPDLLIFGRALRTAHGVFDPARLKIVRELVPRAGKARSDDRPAKIQTQPVSQSPQGDRIFVHDLVLAISIGAYASEHGRMQRVRFAVDATLVGTGRPARDMRDVVSYDLISDAIRGVTQGRHVDFVETLAEEIAERVLVHPRVTSVRIVVEKLDVGPGSVGVEIVRDKARGAV